MLVGEGFLLHKRSVSLDSTVSSWYGREHRKAGRWSLCDSNLLRKTFEAREVDYTHIFPMFGKYSSEALKGIASERTDRAVDRIRKKGGKVVSMYAVLGEHDLVSTLDFPDTGKALATSVALNKMTGVSFTTSPVVEAEIFDRWMTEAREI